MSFDPMPHQERDYPTYPTHPQYVQYARAHAIDPNDEANNEIDLMAPPRQQNTRRRPGGGSGSGEFRSPRTSGSGSRDFYPPRAGGSREFSSPRTSGSREFTSPRTSTSGSREFSSPPTTSNKYTANANIMHHLGPPSPDSSPIASPRHAVKRMPSLYQVKSPDLLEDQRSDLRENGFPIGLAAELGKSRSVYPVRFWILDNSGSMMANDGWSIRGSTSVQCTRWAELQETVNYHANLAGVLQATSIFRMLNDPGVRAGPQEFSIADSGKNYMEEIKNIKKIMQHSKPAGSTPLTMHLVEIAQRIALTESKMRKKGLEAVVIIATDGLPTSPEGHSSDELNDEFIQALQHLQTLPVWVVIRLCTDEQEVVDFYNRLDRVLELPIEVLDDFFAEAKEIQKHNKWLNYAMPLHRCREVGYQHRIFDMLDERPLNKDELKEFCESLFGNEHFAKAPDIHEDFNGFVSLLTKILKNEKPQFNPITKKMQPWIDIKALKQEFGSGGLLGMIKKRTSMTKNR